MWCWHVVLACGAGMWCWHVVLACGAGMWCWHVVLAGGAGRWCWQVVLARYLHKTPESHFGPKHDCVDVTHKYTSYKSTLLVCLFLAATEQFKVCMSVSWLKGQSLGRLVVKIWNENIVYLQNEYPQIRTHTSPPPPPFPLFPIFFFCPLGDREKRNVT